MDRQFTEWILVHRLFTISALSLGPRGYGLYFQKSLMGRHIVFRTEWYTGVIEKQLNLMDAEDNKYRSRGEEILSIVFHLLPDQTQSIS